MYRIVFLISSFIFFQSCKTSFKKEILPYYNNADFTPIFAKSNFEKLKITHQIADFSFLDQDSNFITQKNIDGKISVANFFFTSCGSICPTIMLNLKLTNQAIKYDTNIIFLSYSVTPWMDSVTRLKKYANNNSLKNNWHLLTGNKAKIYELARKSYFAEESVGYSKDSSNFLHTEHVLLIDKQKHIRGIYNGTLPLETEQLAKDIEILKAEN